jgi:hypothetical protein
MAGHGVETSLFVLAVSLLVGGLAIHTGTKLALASKEFSHAVLTALFGAIAWAVVDILLTRVGASGWFVSLVGLVVWIWVVRRRYDIGWLRASVVGVGAWLSALIVLAVLALFGVGNLDAFGVPGV